VGEVGIGARPQDSLRISVSLRNKKSKAEMPETDAEGTSYLDWTNHREKTEAQCWTFFILSLTPPFSICDIRI